ncbi:MAG: type II toxin-antitoxin system RelE/ParE family toxin [Rhizomicrobium sp.]
MKGFAGVLELTSFFDGDAYRAVYTVRFRDVVYVLHAFKKKSKRGIATPEGRHGFDFTQTEAGHGRTMRRYMAGRPE